EEDTEESSRSGRDSVSTLADLTPLAGAERPLANGSVSCPSPPSSSERPKEEKRKDKERKRSEGGKDRDKEKTKAKRGVLKGLGEMFRFGKNRKDERSSGDKMERKGSSKWRPAESQASEDETQRMKMEQESNPTPSTATSSPTPPSTPTPTRPPMDGPPPQTAPSNHDRIQRLRQEFQQSQTVPEDPDDRRRTYSFEQPWPGRHSVSVEVQLQRQRQEEREAFALAQRQYSSLP
ncbi:hypothetical protein CRUP_020577, partial [Coryphaenoides rupestris]